MKSNVETLLPDQIKEHIEQLTHPIFMPRNEEEVLRNIMALSRQLRYVERYASSDYLF